MSLLFFSSLSDKIKTAIGLCCNSPSRYVSLPPLTHCSDMVGSHLLLLTPGPLYRQQPTEPHRLHNCTDNHALAVCSPPELSLTKMIQMMTTWSTSLLIFLPAWDVSTFCLLCFGERMLQKKKIREREKIYFSDFKFPKKLLNSRQKQELNRIVS